MPNTWIHYSSQYTGHPVLTGTAGDLTNLLDKVLADGTTTLSVTSITRSGSVATVTCAAAHGIPLTQTGWRTISGAVETDYNGTFLVTAVTTTTFTYTVPGTPTTPATGTILYNTPAAGWSKAFTATNRRAYYMGAASVARKYFRVRDDAAHVTAGAKEAQIRGFTTMSDVNTGTGPCPTSAQSSLTDNSLIIRKSAAADATVRQWDVWADEQTCILLVSTGDTAGCYQYTYFGAYLSSAASDTTAAMLVGQYSENTATPYASTLGFCGDTTSSVNSGSPTNSGRFVFGDFGGFNSSTLVGVCFFPFAAAGSIQTNGIIPYPNPVDGGLYLYTPILYRTNGASLPNVIGCPRGIFVPLHPPASFSDGDVFDGSGDYAGRKFMIRKTVGVNAITTPCVALENSTTPAVSV